MFKVFLLFLIFLFNVCAQEVQAQSHFKESEGEQERQLSKYLNASSVCSKMTDSNALFDRGMLLLEDKNEEAYLAAADCFTSAAMRNHVPSQIELGKLYEKGQGVGESLIFAYKWYQTAILLGSKDAVTLRDRLESAMSLDDIAVAMPMVQSTLDLLDLFENQRLSTVETFEEQVSTEYRKFGIDIAQYETKEEQASSYENPLIEVLIRDQLAKEKAAEGGKEGGEVSEKRQRQSSMRERFLKQSEK